MITKLSIRNFKGINYQEYEFGQFELLVGANNSGKSTVLQALAVWQFCIAEIVSKNSFSETISHNIVKILSRTTNFTVSLSNFTVLPIPKFELLWQENFISNIVEIEIYWKKNDQLFNFSIGLEYQSADNIAISTNAKDVQYLFDLLRNSLLPNISFVPLFSNLEAQEEKRTELAIRQDIGKAKAGSVIRNLLLKLSENPKDWSEFSERIHSWFAVDLLLPEFDEARDVYIQCEYRKDNCNYDIISGGSGFHQIVILLAFMYCYRPATLLLDEPDAHLHINLQQEIVSYFKQKSLGMGIQFIIATHSEAMINHVETGEIMSLLSQKPRRIEQKSHLVQALEIITTVDALQIMEKKRILYLEGEDDARLLLAWEKMLGLDTLRHFHLCFMRGGSTEKMIEDFGRHFKAVREIEPAARRFMLFDQDGKQGRNIPPHEYMYEWKRKNIENYLLVPPAWIRALRKGDRAAQAMIEAAFEQQGLLGFPKENESWKTISANIFLNVDGKEILFSSENSLFNQLSNINKEYRLNRETVALSMLPEEIHEDIGEFFEKLEQMV